MAPPAAAAAAVIAPAAKDYKRESGTARLLGSGLFSPGALQLLLLINDQGLLELPSSLSFILCALRLFLSTHPNSYLTGRHNSEAVDEQYNKSKPLAYGRRPTTNTRGRSPPSKRSMQSFSRTTLQHPSPPNLPLSSPVLVTQPATRYILELLLITSR